MTNREMFAKFRAEIDDMYAPEILKRMSQVIRITDNGEDIGILCVDNGYIEGMYVLPEYRRKGYGKKAILNYIDKYGTPKDLTILNCNKVALKFWNELFILEKSTDNGIDTYYKIIDKQKIQGEIICTI